MLHQYVKTVQIKVEDSKKLFKVAMIDVESALNLEDEYSPLSTPEVRFFL